MGRRRSKKGSNKIGTIAALLVLATLTVGIPGLAIARVHPSWKGFFRNAAVASALYNMPQNAMELLEERFNQEIDPDGFDPPIPPSPPDIDPVVGESSPGVQEPVLPEEQSNPSASPAPAPTEQQSASPQEIPVAYQGDVIEEDMSVSGGTAALACYGVDGKESSGFVKNTTKLENTAVMKWMQGEDSVAASVSKDAATPQVLIMHTHATESFEDYDSAVYDTRTSWRTTDNKRNVVAVGEKVAEGLRAHGISVLHDETQHDYPSYNGSYERSAVTVESYLEQYPSIRVVLDVHRDAVQRGETLVKPLTMIDGKKTAQVMIIAGCDDGTMDMPNWKTNLRFASGLQNAMESQYPGLTRPVFFCYRRYNQQLTTGSLLLEFGSHGNTLEEVLRTGTLVGEAIGTYLAQDPIPPPAMRSGGESGIVVY